MSVDIRPEIRQVIDQHREAILAFLADLVACNSFSHNKAGVDEMGKMVAREMPQHFSHRIVRNDRLGDHHVYSSLREDAPVTSWPDTLTRSAQRIRASATSSTGALRSWGRVSTT